MSKKIDKAVIDELTSLKGSGISIPRIPFGDLISLLGTKDRLYYWLMDVLEHPKKREQILREYKRQTAETASNGRVCVCPRKRCCGQ